MEMKASTSLKKILNGMVNIPITLNINGEKVTQSLKISINFPGTFEANYFTFRGKIITYFPAYEGQEYNNEGGWKREGRKEMKVRTFVDEFLRFDPELDDKFKNRFCELLIHNIKGFQEQVRFLESDDVKSIYDMEGINWSSCMSPGSSHDCSEHSKFYNQAGAKIIYNESDDGLIFRALKWECEDLEGNKVIFIDRIYSTDDLAEAVYLSLEDVAKRTRYCSTIYYKGESIKLRYKLSDSALEYLQEEGVPYLDTLHYLDGDCLTNYVGDDIQHCSGNPINEGYSYCCQCDRRFHDDDLTWINDEPYCDFCRAEEFIICERCGDWINNDDGFYYEFIEQWLCDDCAERKGIVRCDDCEEHYYERDLYTINLDNGNTKQVCEDCLENYYECDGEWYESEQIKERIENECC